MDDNMKSKMEEGLAKYASPIVTKSKGPKKQEVMEAIQMATSGDEKQCK